ncbi:transposase [Micromonospora sp. NPDC047707]|uniref:transposase n=1 Tax=Micromonospora sp. NPDC047707 TaxID=3154498 RepID=UPI003452383B
MAAGDNPDRRTGEASFAALCGVSPVERSSGKPSAAASTAAATDRPTPHCSGSP